MNVAQGTGTSANLYPPTQSKSDTQSVTASGQWTVCESTRRLLPGPSRESERQELLQAAETGRLAFRRIRLTEENDYFSGQRAPRPFTLALPGGMMPTKPIPKIDFGKSMVGIVDPQCLYVYKFDGYTGRLLIDSSATPETLRAKLLPDLQSSLNRRLEHGNQVIWRVYPHRFTSGHLQEDGTFSLPKLKYDNDIPFLDYPELVLTQYDKEDIKCFCAYKDAQINIAEILGDKRQCEKVLKIKSLPLVIYCYRTGSVEVYFDDELNNKHLARNEDSMDYFAISQGIAPENFRAMLNLLPMSLRTEALSSELTVSPDASHKLQQAIKLVSNPRYYSYEELLKLKQSGLAIHQPFFQKGHFKSLLDMLLTQEMFRNEQTDQEQSQKQEETADRMFRLILQSGASLPKEWCLKFIERMDDSFSYTMPPGIMNCMLAAFRPFKFLTLLHLRRISLSACPGALVEFDRICQRLSQQQRQDALEQILRQDLNDRCRATLDTVQSHLLALFSFGASLNKNFLKSFQSCLQKEYREGEKVIADFSADDYITWLKKLWDQRATHSLYQNWPEHVRQAERDIRDLQQSLDQVDSGPSATALTAQAPAALKFVVDAFSKPPVLPDTVGDNEKTILKVLLHYYRRPGPERVVRSLGRQTIPAVWKPLHSCSHVLRARNNGHWYMELLKKFQQCSLSKQEKELLSLAIIYHDAAAEDVDKSAEETRSAEYFKRDLTGHYPKQLLENIVLAMVSKENDVEGKDEQNLPDSVRWYLRILRFADRMDFIRCSGIGADFPGLTATRTQGFDATRLDIPPQLTGDFTAEPDDRTEFQRHLEAAMHGAADLARVTGQLQDRRKKNYTRVYGLNSDASKISENFEWTTEPVQRMNQFIDNNVRRKMAQEAGIIVCSDPSHQACKADQKKGITRGIHNSWYDLRQVTIPAGMTLLEKMQYEHDPSLLSPATQKALAKEVQRLKSEGIRMNPGTLTQTTLTSEEARKVLEQRGIAVVSEKRPFLTNQGFPREREMLVPKEIFKPDAQSEPVTSGTAKAPLK
ncbi:hypothetical protein [Endozoicomonas sp. 8E]|uniref:hypothetical protein n=1 Tax=Endozoicomonas sp. 8E TaxID=3035692 RepID=UPI002938F9D4|nr:hypothetical protein [Endozoicomonas sp. 8E]WOG29141.1 hypothetical protein P6910_05605 [Endozoicomonas sp. 8E]